MSAWRAECFGKLPLHGDFIRHQASPELLELDRWIQEGVGTARARADWSSTWPATPPLRFVRHAPKARLLVGVMIPSRDSAGRDYPFVVASALDARELARQPELAPLACEPMFAALEELLARSWDQGSYRDVQAALDRTGGQLDLRAAERALAQALGETSLERLLEEELGAWDERRFLLLGNAASLLGPRSRPRFTLQLPAGKEPLRTAVWMSLVTALRGGAERFPPLCTWSTSGPGAEAGLRLLLTDLAGEHFLPLVMRHLASDACDLAREGLESQSLMQKSRERFASLAVPGVRLSELQQKLAAAAR